MKPQFQPRASFARLAARGFTLVELLITIAIMAILLGIAAPAFTEAILSNKLAGYANTFVAGTSVARSEAIKRNFAITMCRSADGATCATSGGWQQGWIVMCNSDDSLTCKSGGSGVLVLNKQEAIETGFQLTGDAYTLTFPPTGGGVTTANLVLCRNSPAGAQERTIKVGATGRAAVAKTTTGTCS